MLQKNTNKPENFYLKLVQRGGWADGTHPPSMYTELQLPQTASTQVHVAFPVGHEWASLNQERQMKFYKIQALYVPSFIKKSSEKYLIKATGTEKALGVLPLVIVTYTQCKQDSINK